MLCRSEVASGSERVLDVLASFILPETCLLVRVPHPHEGMGRPSQTEHF